MNNELRWKQRFSNFERAYHTFHRMRDVYEKDPTSETGQLALIHIYRSTFELAWKVMQDYLENKGFDIKSPRQALTQAFENKIITKGEAWLAGIDYRNKVAYAYNDKVLEEVVHFIAQTFAPLVKDFYDYLKTQST